MPSATTWLSSSSRLADARSPAMFAATDPMASDSASRRSCPASRAPITARASAGLAAVGSLCSTARKPRRKYGNPPSAGLPGPDASSSSSHLTPSEVARVIQYQPMEQARSIPRGKSPWIRHRRSTDRMLSICSSPTPGDVEVGASQFDNVLLAGLPELEAGVFAHRLVQPIAGAALGVLSHHQGLVDKR